MFLHPGSAPPKMTGEEIERYIQKKLKRNDQVLRINGKNLGDEGVAHLAQSSLLKTVSVPFYFIRVTLGMRVCVH
ncbi:MAG: hypothetical protein Ct9H300mP23_11870 [Nitrospinota bacterium]|nr:MAG: hypothetical protein Ct9H300mP23_11870 [Nitrospinota bacterium]